ncbi:unknown [Collinsella sp. CAG:289]|nr:unknown [Collinsella sp. CAG:289]
MLTRSGLIRSIGIGGSLFCLGKLILQLLELLLLLLRAACIVGGIDVVVQELLELGDSEISLSVISAVIEYGYLGIGVLTATCCNTDGDRSGINDVEIVPALLVDAVVVLIDVIGIISVATEVVAILRDVLIECLLLLGVETGVGPTECILGLAAGICAASAGKIFPVVEIAVRVSPDVR